MDVRFSNTFGDINIDRDALTVAIQQAIPQESNVMIYSMDARKNLFRMDEQHRLTILTYATPSRAEGMEEFHGLAVGDNIVSLSSPIKRLPKILRNIAGITHLLDDHGLQIAHYDEPQNIMYIPFRIFSSAIDQDTSISLLKAILKVFKEKFLDVRHLKYSWIGTPDREELTRTFKQRLERQASRQLQEDHEQLRRTESNINDYVRRLKQEHDKTIRLRKSVLEGTENANNAVGKLLRDLDLIVQHDSFVDVRIKDGKITLITDEIYAWTKQDKRYHIGKFEIDVNMDNTEVKFRGSNPRRSFWSNNDMHPHVSHRGDACLGNVGSSIAELCSQSELYALSLVIIDYLQNVNIDDIAGKFVMNWDEVDEKGVVIKEGYRNGPGNMRGPAESNNDDDDDDEEESFHCDNCEERCTGDNFRVYTSYDGNGDISGEQNWCDGCTDEGAHYNSDADEYVTHDVDGDLDNYHN